MLRGGKEVGSVTSGLFCPTLDRPAAMAYVEPDCLAVGTALTVDVRGSELPAAVAALPFYRRAQGVTDMDLAKLLYTKSHEWAAIEGDVCTIGITQYAVEQLTDVTHLQLPKVGAAVTAGKPFGEIESVKAVFDLNAPITGDVVEKNAAAEKNPSAINADPYGQGWLIRVKVPAGVSTAHLLTKCSTTPRSRPPGTDGGRAGLAQSRETSGSEIGIPMPSRTIRRKASAPSKRLRTSMISSPANGPASSSSSAWPSAKCRVVTHVSAKTMLRASASRRM